MEDKTEKKYLLSLDADTFARLRLDYHLHLEQIPLSISSVEPAASIPTVNACVA